MTTGATDGRAEQPGPVPAAAIVRGLIAALIGAVAGYVLFHALLHHGYYLQVMPGALTGFACGLASRRRSEIRCRVSSSDRRRRAGRGRDHHDDRKN